jgi:hypothetical protein
VNNDPASDLPQNAAPSDVLTRLKQLQAIVAGVQRRIQRDIKAIEGNLTEK